MAAEAALTSHTQDRERVSPLIGAGLYSVDEAAVYTATRASDIRRWLFGYRRGGKHYPPLWKPELAESAEHTLGFRDLLEIRFVAAFRQHQVSLQTIRLAAAHARELFRQEYPFTCKRFQTDGRSIFATVQEETGDENLLDLVKKQHVFRQIVSSSLYEGIEYTDDGQIARRWYPVRNSKRIVLDPARQFGKAILSSSGIPTETLLQAYRAEGSDLQRVARLFEIPPREVESALAYERELVS